MTSSSPTLLLPGRRNFFGRLLSLACAALVAACASAPSGDPLPSWNDGASKRAIIEFVRSTTEQGSPKFIPPSERLAAFDQDGTTWVEQPIYTEVQFALDRVRELAPKNPAWKDRMPFKAVIDGDRAAMAKFTERDLLEVVAAAYGGQSPEALTAEGRTWIAKAQHPRFKRPFTELAYQPMLEVMRYLRDNGYQVYLNTGGTQPFVRAFAEPVYGVRPDQVVGTALKAPYVSTKDGNGLVIDPEVRLNNNYGGKAEDFLIMTGRRPKATFGNSDGDEQMLAFSQGGTGSSLQMLVLHDDAVREYAYGPATGLPDSKVGAFSQALYDQARQRGWHVISIKNDWKRVFAFEPLPN